MFKNSRDRMMPRTGDRYLNMKHFHDDPLKEALKLKMLNQEDTFKKQVQELHRLYQMQMMLMKNLQLKGVVTKQSVNCSEGILPRPLDAKVSASGCVKHIDQHFLKKGDGWGTRENPVQVEYYCPGDTESSLDEVNLSLSIGGGTKQKRSGRKFWHENFTSVSSLEIIDLEESSYTELSGDIEPMAALGCIAGSAEPGNLQGNKSNCISVNGTNKDLANGIKGSESLIDESRTYLEQNLNQGFTKWLGDFRGGGVSPVTKVFSSHEALCLDLNKPLLDESLFDSKDLAMESSAGACSGVTERVAGDIHKGSSPDGTSWTIRDNNCSNEVSAIIQQDTLNIMMMASNSTYSSTNTRGGKALSPDIESSLRSPSDCCESHDCLTGNSQHKDPEPGSTFFRRNDKGQTVVGANDDIMGDKNAEFSHLCCRANPVEDRDSSPAARKSDFMTIDHTCSSKTVQCGIYLGKSDLSHINSSPNSESSENESFSPDESKSVSFDEKKEVPTQDDSLVERGAASLMYLFLESSRREHDGTTEVDEANEIGNEKRDQPQCSSDTFESMVLKLQESNAEDYCVTSNPLEVISTDNKDYGVKLRRGRRMKDFQKDILPSLASLSRHEISEDVRIMEGVIRSREYKRLRSKMSSSQNWFTPVRSRRSRLNYVGRKHYS